MEYNLCYFSVIILMVILSSPIILAAWTNDNPPKGPTDVMDKKTCTEWIIFHGFLPGHNSLNIKKAVERKASLDGKVFSWAAGYAYELSASNLSPLVPTLSPNEFCIDRKVRNSPYYFKRLEDEQITCTDWLHLYGYEHDNKSLNWTKALTRNFSMDNDIPFWVAGYGQVLNRLFQAIAVSPAEFCLDLGMKEYRLLPFMTQNATNLACYDWIKYNGFTDDHITNYILSKKVYNYFFWGFIHYWAKQFSDYISSFKVPVELTPLEYCRLKQVSDDTKFSFFSS